MDFKVVLKVDIRDVEREREKIWSNNNIIIVENGVIFGCSCSKSPHRPHINYLADDVCCSGVDAYPGPYHNIGHAKKVS